MDLAWDDRRTRQAVSNVGIVTSDGSVGPNIMSAEWVHHISYSPSLMAICLKPSDATHKNVTETKEFGLHLCSADQNVLASVAGGSSGAKVDKISVLKELGFEFYEAKHIKPLLLKNAAMTAECKVIKEMDFGDHTMFVGEVEEISANPEMKPLIYHNGMYWTFGEQMHRPPQEKLDEIAQLVEKYTR